MLKQFIAITCLAGFLFTACQSVSNGNLSTDSLSNTGSSTDSIKTVHAKPADATTILSRPQVPVICYHQIREWRPRDSESAKDYIIEPENFKAQIKMLADSGYHTILPGQLYDYLVYGKELPSKPVMLTFDDTDLDQYTIAAPELKKYGYKAVYFIMTVSIGRTNYMNSEQIKELSDEGNIIASHTWDHHNFKKLTGDDWKIQLDKPTKRLEDITGKKIEYFAYPFGLWNTDGLPELKIRGIKLAFQLSAKRDQQDPLMTVRRILGSGHWSAKTLHNNMKNSF
ncbi:polysaccharide deacetylase family protein [Mucilaginibacter sp. JRF]|uniref:polysaccharide deacetylase family protein n=1 Tax=Mucilaginibacter sp. JRF TaxID=2780088 RepID=UPI0018828163|nr:polysaccharide deacetylase family protein [Mucilaginibacter sp. JRF]MBE9583815.1 polysaccharide deacetylase family protein [Mucilaginibacter sp. JRF]